jgi:glutathione peroxidase
LYETYNSATGLEILAFPCNNFGFQEPGSNSSIQDFVKQKGSTFPVLGKLECEPMIQSYTHPLYIFLRTQMNGGTLGPCEYPLAFFIFLYRLILCILCIYV